MMIKRILLFLLISFFFTSPCYAVSFIASPILDDFNRSDEGPPPSSDWTTITGDLRVVSNEVKGNDAFNIATWTADSFSANQKCFITITGKSDTNDDIISVIARGQDSGADTYDVCHILKTAATDRIVLRRVDDTVPTVLNDTAQELTAGDSIGIRAIGDTIESWYHNGTVWVLIASVTDNTYPNTGDIGLLIQNTVATCDNFGGGEVGIPIYRRRIEGE